MKSAFRFLFRQNDLRTGYVLAALAALLWGTSGVLARRLFSRQALHPFDLLLMRTVVAAALNYGWLRLLHPPLLKFARRDWWRLALFGVIGLAINQACYYLALRLTSVSYALLLQYTMPVMLLVYSWLTRAERLTRGKVLAGLLTLAGCGWMMKGQFEGGANFSLAGTLFALGSACAFGFYSVWGKELLRKYDTRTVMANAWLFAAAFWLVVHPLWQMPWASFDAQVFAFAGFIALFGTVLPFGLYLASLKYVEASRASMTAMLEPVFASALAWVWLGERMSGAQLAGAAVILVGVVLVQREA